MASTEVVMPLVMKGKRTGWLARGASGVWQVAEDRLDLARASHGITSPLLTWLPTSLREATARRLPHRARRDLDDPDSVPAATAAAELLNPGTTHPSPADEVWLPVDASVDSPRAIGCTSCSATPTRRPGRTSRSCVRQSRQNSLPSGSVITMKPALIGGPGS
jgi:hypothetical protein